MIPSNIGRQDIITAIDDIRKSGVQKGRGSSRFQLVVDGQAFPPKYVVSLANRYVNGEELDPSTFGGGSETNLFLTKLGFQVVEGPSQAQKTRMERPNEAAPIPTERLSSRKDPQKKALLDLLKRRFGVVETEASFDWLVVPDWNSMDAELMRIAEALAQYRGYKEFFSPGIHLNPDYFIVSQKLIIEYDERQHFTIPRAIALENYPKNMDLSFDLKVWISFCRAIRAKDPTPYYRDEQRAFYDSLRDILASRNGFTVLRIKDGEYDWTLPDAKNRLNRLLGQVVKGNNSTNSYLREHTITSKTSKIDVKSRIVSVCILGQPIKDTRANAERQELLQKAICEIGNRGWSNLDAIVLPGGFFYLDQYFGPLSYTERVAALENTSFHNICTDSCHCLSQNSPGMVIAIGVDTVEPGNPAGFWGDQLCIAWNEKGIVGIGRKVFPVSPPRNQDYKEENDESVHYICYAEDYRDRNRIVSLANGANTVICACYDIFGCAENPEEFILTERTRNIKYINDGTRLHQFNTPPHPGSNIEYFKVLRRDCVNGFHRLLKTNRVAIALGAIHKDPSARYWQIHGIQACSAGIDGGLVVGAAHFSTGLPQSDEHILSACNIPFQYLKMANKNSRQMMPWQYRDRIRDDKFLIRLFEVDSANTGTQ